MHITMFIAHAYIIVFIANNQCNAMIV